MIQQMQQLPTMKTQLLFDLESTGLLRRGSRIHCIVMRDAIDGSTTVFDHQPERDLLQGCLLYTSPSPRDRTRARMPSSA